jgi:hypothetical protein
MRQRRRTEVAPAAAQMARVVCGPNFLASFGVVAAGDVLLAVVAGRLGAIGAGGGNRPRDLRKAIAASMRPPSLRKRETSGRARKPMALKRISIRQPGPPTKCISPSSQGVGLGSVTFTRATSRNNGPVGRHVAVNRNVGDARHTTRQKWPRIALRSEELGGRGRSLTGARGCSTGESEDGAEEIQYLDRQRHSTAEQAQAKSSR